MKKTFNYGHKIRERRQKRNIRSKDLAKKLEIDASFLSLIEHNRRVPSSDLLLKICKELNLDNKDLIENSDPGLENNVKDIVKISLLEDLDIRPDEAEEIARINPKIAKALHRLGKDHIDKEHSLERKIKEKDVFQGDLVADFIQERKNWFPNLEDFATKTNEKIKIDNRKGYESICEYLKSKHNINVVEKIPTEEESYSRDFKKEEKKLFLSDLQPQETKKFFAAYTVAQLEADDLIEEELNEYFPFKKNNSVRTDAKKSLLNYVAGSILMEYNKFFQECVKKHRYDLELLQNIFGCSFEQICHRVTTLQKEGQSGIPMHMLRVDRCGNVSKRFSLSGIELPKSHGACVLWNVFSSFSTPGKITAAVSKMTDGERYICIARTVEKGITRYGEEKGLLSIGLGCKIEHSKKFIYADRLNLDDTKSEVKIGVSCRTCDRKGCSQRAYPHLTGYRPDTSYRGASNYD